MTEHAVLNEKKREHDSKKSTFLRRSARLLLLIFINLLLLEVLSWFVVMIAFKQNYGAIAGEKNEYMYQLTGKSKTHTLVRPAGGQDRSRRQLHPYFGYTFQPGWRNANNHGFASRYTYPYVAQRDEFVVGIFGGSVAASIHNLDRNHNIIAQSLLSKLKDKGYNRVTTLNFACGGYRQPQDLFAFLYFLNTIDMGIFIEGFNEVTLITEGQHDYPFDFPWPAVWNVLAGKEFSQAMLETVGELQYNIARRKAWTKTFQTPVIRHSMFCHLLWKIITKSIAAKEQTLRSEIQKEDNKSGGIANVNPKGYGKKQIIDLYFQRYAQHLETAWRMGRAAKIPCLFVLQPNQYVKDSKPYSPEELGKFLGNKTLQTQVNRYYPRLREMYAGLALKGLFTFDATMLFKNTTQTVYRDQCCHFNALGREMICRAMMKKLLTMNGSLAVIPNAGDRENRLLVLTEPPVPTGQ